MICIDKNSINPWFNLAADEFVLKNMSEDVFLLWQSAESIVIGKHQLPHQEVDLSILEKENIQIIRRISGGGTVYHGPGNINFSFITTENADKVNFQKFSEPIIHYLNELGISAAVSGKSNITIADLKISGNAASVHKSRSLHHGTLLFESDTQRLDYLLSKPKKLYKTKAVMSNRAKVTTIADHLPHKISFDEFCIGLKRKIVEYFEISEVRQFTDDETSMILKLSHDKYQNYNWNFGYSPDYQVDCKTTLHGEVIYFSLSIKQGRVNAVISPDNVPAKILDIIQKNLFNIQHLRTSVYSSLLPVKQELTDNDDEFNDLINNIL
jgi:lipoate-protein ligase A